MIEKPELIVISQNLTGGGASFHRNMLANMPTDFFETKIIYLSPQGNLFTKSTEVSLTQNDIIFEYELNKPYKLIKNLSNLISNKKGALVANLPEELLALSYFPKQNKTIYFICHDDGFLALVKRYQNIIDVFITHNYSVYNEIKKIIPNQRHKNLFFIPHGVQIQQSSRKANVNTNLKIVFLARHHELKGIHELPKINEILLSKGIYVDWTILGDGPEREMFLKSISNLKNFNCFYLDTNKEVLECLINQDIFILPSKKDGLPVSLLEAMSVGVVPIVSNFSEGIKNVISEKIGSIVEIGNNNQFAIEIENLHKNRNILELKSKNAKAEIEKNYDIKFRAIEYYNLYKNFDKFATKKSKFNFILFLKKIYYKYFFEYLNKIK